MKALRITTVFDLRSDPEMKKYSTPVPTIEGVQMVPNPVFRNEDYSPESIAKCVLGSKPSIPLDHIRLMLLTENSSCTLLGQLRCETPCIDLLARTHNLLQAFMKLYSQILDHAGNAFGTILRHVRDKPNTPFLFHCTGAARYR